MPLLLPPASPRLVIAYNQDNLFTRTTCQAAVELAQQLTKLNPDFSLVKVFNYSAAQTRDSAYLQRMVADSISLGADGFVGCELKPGAMDITRCGWVPWAGTL